MLDLHLESGFDAVGFLCVLAGGGLEGEGVWGRGLAYTSRG